MRGTEAGLIVSFLNFFKWLLQQQNWLQVLVLGSEALSYSPMSINWQWTDFQRRQWHPTPVLLPEKSHGRRIPVGCSLWGHQALDMTEWLHFHFSFSCIGEGNGNPLQCSCLENPRDGEAWWAAVYGVTKSRTWLKWLSSRTVFTGKEKNRNLIWWQYLKLSDWWLGRLMYFQAA